MRIINFNVAKVRNAIPKIALYLRRERPRGVISQITHANLVCLIARAIARTKTPLVAVEHNQFSAMRAAGGCAASGAQARSLALSLGGPYRRSFARALPATSSSASDFRRSGAGTIYNPIVDAGCWPAPKNPARILG